MGGKVGKWERGNVGQWEGGNVGTWEGRVGGAVVPGRGEGFVNNSVGSEKNLRPKVENGFVWVICWCGFSPAEPPCFAAYSSRFAAPSLADQIFSVARNRGLRSCVLFCCVGADTGSRHRGLGFRWSCQLRCFPSQSYNNSVKCDRCRPYARRGRFCHRICSRECVGRHELVGPRKF